jgi:glycine/D-amino acid oxidase-like deaminating enzyme
MKISIVGAGIMGLSAAWALERLGHEVVLFEQGPIPNPLASSHDRHRLIRFAYGAAAGYTRMVGDAYALWDRLWADLGEALYQPTGTLALSNGTGRWSHDSAETLARAGHAVEWLAPAELARRFPLLDADAIGQAFYLPSGGVLLADRILVALAGLLARRGVDLRAHTPIRHIDPDRGQVTTADGTIMGADVVIVAAGPWMARLAPGLATRVTPSRQVLAYIQPPARLEAAWRDMPMLLDIDAETGFYAVPPVGEAGLKFGDHRFSRVGDPDLDRDAANTEGDGLLAAGRRRLAAGAEYRIASLKTCFYTVEADEKFIIEPFGTAGWVMSPCSGHGFKFGPLIGSAVAGAIDSGEVGDISPWAAGEET